MFCIYANYLQLKKYIFFVYLQDMVSNANEPANDGPRVPAGEYRLVAWDLDTTGRRLIDEICQIAAYTPSSAFSQYVMPFRDPNPGAQRRHNIRVITIGRFRMLKNVKNNKLLKTKSEVSALSDFIDWLEKVKGPSNGVILVCHETRKVITPLLIEALRKYNLFDAFKHVVKGFANGYNIAEEKCAKSVRSFSLRTLSRMLLNREDDLDNASDRARAIYEVVQRVSGVEDTDKQGGGDGDETEATSRLVEAIRNFCHPIDTEEEYLAGLKEVVERQNSLRPVFEALLRIGRRERQRATFLRRLLAEAGIDYACLVKAFKEGGKEQLDKEVQAKTKAKPKDMEELLKLLGSHFVPSEDKKTEETTATNTTAPTSPPNGPANPAQTASPPPIKSEDTSTSSLIKAEEGSPSTPASDSSLGTQPSTTEQVLSSPE